MIILILLKEFAQLKEKMAKLGLKERMEFSKSFVKNTMKKTIDVFNQKIALCPRLTFSDGVKPMSGSLLSAGLFSLCCCCGESGLFDISLLFGAKLSFGVSHHRHFGMSSSYSLPHFLQIIVSLL